MAPAWATVRVLRLQSFEDKGKEVYLHPVLRNIRELHDVPIEVTAEVATAEPPWRITRMSGCVLQHDAPVPEMLAPAGLPALTTLELTEAYGGTSIAARIGALLRSPLGKQLELLRFRVYPNSLGEYAAEVLAHARVAVEIDVYRATLRFERGALTATGDYGDEPFTPILAQLPAKTFRSVTIAEGLRSPAVTRAATRLKK